MAQIDAPTHCPTCGQPKIRRKLSDDDVRAIRELHAQGKTRQEIAERYGVALLTVSHVVNRRFRFALID